MKITNAEIHLHNLCVIPDHQDDVHSIHLDAVDVETVADSTQTLCEVSCTCISVRCGTARDTHRNQTTSVIYKPTQP